MLFGDSVTRPTVEWSDPHPKTLDGLSKEEVKAARARHLVEETSGVETRQRAWHEMALWNSTLYTNRQLSGFHWGFADPVESELYPANLATENLVKSIGGSMLSKASSSPIMPMVIPHGMSWKTRRKVKRLNRWIQGTWRQLRLEDLAIRAFLDAYLCGIGVVRLDHDSSALCAEGVFFDNVIVDNAESCNRTPPRKYRIRYMAPRCVIEELYGVSLDRDETSRRYVEHRDSGKDWVPVVEGWMPARGGQAGRHCIACCGQLLQDEVWTSPVVPLVIFKWDDEISGFYSPSGVEDVVPYQLRLNELNEVIRDAQDVCARPRLLAQAGSRFDVAALDNLVARIVTYTGQPPTPFNWNTAIQELYAERDRVVESCFRFFGLSQMTSQGELPPSVRLDSSAGVREFRTMEDSRFLRLWTRFEQFRLDLARRCVDVMSIDPSAEHVTVWQSGGRAHIEQIVWTEVADITKDQYTWSLEALPASAGSAAARRDQVEGRIAQGRLSPEDGNEMTSAPDLESMEDLATARCDEQKWVVEEAEEGRYVAPDPMMNLVYGIQLMSANLALLRQYKDVPENVKTIHRRYVRAALAIIQPGAENPTAPAVPSPTLAPPIPAASPPPGAAAAMNYGKA